jgi:hypothetical protein
VLSYLLSLFWSASTTLWCFDVKNARTSHVTRSVLRCFRTWVHTFIAAQVGNERSILGQQFPPRPPLHTISTSKVCACHVFSTLMHCLFNVCFPKLMLVLSESSQMTQKFQFSCRCYSVIDKLDALEITISAAILSYR